MEKVFRAHDHEGRKETSPGDGVKNNGGHADFPFKNNKQ